MASTEFEIAEAKLLAAKSGKPSWIDVPVRRCLMIDGIGDPDSSERFHDAIQALYSLVYTAKFALKGAAPERSFKVMALEALWSSDEGGSLSTEERSKWRWTLFISVPMDLANEEIERFRAEVIQKRQLAAVAEVRVESFCEGLCAQVMHVGPYSSERPTIELLHRFIQESGRSLRGRHHEVYLGDPRRAAPEKLKTILRQPVE